jgi:hypothetical protein
MPGAGKSRARGQRTRHPIEMPPEVQSRRASSVKCSGCTWEARYSAQGCRGLPRRRPLADRLVRHAVPAEGGRSFSGLRPPEAGQFACRAAEPVAARYQSGRAVCSAGWELRRSGRRIRVRWAATTQPAGGVWIAVCRGHGGSMRAADVVGRRRSRDRHHPHGLSSCRTDGSHDIRAA